MRDTRVRAPREGGCPEEVVLDSWVDDGGPYLRLGVQERGSERTGSQPPALPGLPAARPGRMPQA